MKTDAPNINGTYPLAGERIGPAWRTMWAQLSATTWTDGPSLAGEVAAAHGITPSTASNLLRQARQVGLLEVRQVRARGGNHRVAEYRVTSCYLDWEE